MRKTMAILLFSAFVMPILAKNYRLFHIRRNKNRNLVQYAIRLDGKCQPKGRKPVYGYWRMLEKGASATEKIGYWEEMAYGIKAQKRTAAGMTVRLEAVPERALTVAIAENGGKCQVTTLTQIKGKQDQLREIYVFAKENFLGLPTVKYVDLTGKSRKERLKK